ncbi:MAG: hypothetical protein Q4D26_01810 [Clostridia bacterium]|nr:hypothetical protein [Clostridia bacterium]
MAYSRVFIALKQGCQDYAKDIRGSVGRCVIELRNGAGRLILQAQGLRSDCDYRVCILSRESYAEVARPLYVDGTGKGEVKWEFSPNEIGLEVSDIKAVAVLVKDKAPLIGFVEGEYNWQRCLMAKNMEDTSIKAAVADSGAESTETESEGENINEKEKLICIISELDKDIDEIKEYSRIGTADGEKYLFSRENVNPFGDDGINWIKANIKELCLVKSLWKYINNPFVIKGCRDYKHLLIGKNGDIYLLGVPGKYDKEYRLEAMAQGFNEFKSVDKRPPEQGNFCYYILKC